MELQMLAVASLIDGYVFPGIGLPTVIQAAVNLLSVFVLFIILRFLLHKPVSEFLQRRAERIDGGLKFAEDERAAAALLKAEYEGKVKEIEREKHEIIEAARQISADKSRESEAKARSEADNIRVKAMKEIESEKERASGELKQTVIEVSAAMVAKFLDKTIDDATHEQLFNETMAELKI